MQPDPTCYECGAKLDTRDERHCDRCKERFEVNDEVGYIIARVEAFRHAHRTGDRREAVCSLRDARHTLEDLERLIGVR